MIQRFKTLAIIPARGGSKGIPRKNSTLFAGIPLVAHSIIHARQTPSVGRVVVSTDDTQISTFAKQWGAEVVVRPTELGSDTATSESALLHVLEHFANTENYDPDIVVFLQATSPLRMPGEIQRAIETFIRENADSLLSVGPIHGFVWRVEKDGGIHAMGYDPQNRPRRQDAPEDFVENGSIYIFKPWVLRQLNNRLGGKIVVHRMNALDSFQIDEPGDIELLEGLINFRSRAAIAIEEVSGHKISPPLPTLDPRSLRPSVSSVLDQIRLLVLDFDGVLTDNRVLVDENGLESVLCSRSDGLGIAATMESGLAIMVLSKERNPVVAARCRKLNVEFVQGCDDKLAALKEICAVRQIKADEVAYMGNDINDLGCMSWVGLPIAVADAEPEAKQIAVLTTAHAGGQGAVREICDDWLKRKR
jgi:N-acylneuraminate cytidylyltransferase